MPGFSPVAEGLQVGIQLRQAKDRATIEAQAAADAHARAIADQAWQEALQRALPEQQAMERRKAEADLAFTKAREDTERAQAKHYEASTQTELARAINELGEGDREFLKQIITTISTDKDYNQAQAFKNLAAAEPAIAARFIAILSNLPGGRESMVEMATGQAPGPIVPGTAPIAPAQQQVPPTPFNETPMGMLLSGVPTVAQGSEALSPVAAPAAPVAGGLAPQSAVLDTTGMRPSAVALMRQREAAATLSGVRAKTEESRAKTYSKVQDIYADARAKQVEINARRMDLDERMKPKELGVKQKNASTSAMNAETSAYRARLQAGNLGITGAKYQDEIRNDALSNYTRAVGAYNTSNAQLQAMLKYRAAVKKALASGDAQEIAAAQAWQEQFDRMPDPNVPGDEGGMIQRLQPVVDDLAEEVRATKEQARNSQANIAPLPPETIRALNRSEARNKAAARRSGGGRPAPKKKAVSWQEYFKK